MRRGSRRRIRMRRGRRRRRRRSRIMGRWKCRKRRWWRRELKIVVRVRRIRRHSGPEGDRGTKTPSDEVWARRSKATPPTRTLVLMKFDLVKMNEVKLFLPIFHVALRRIKTRK
ncbi:unnamed protein product [Nesidiocoris tenuis]|uniref:Uncharacterized protein n=1 Tax=Nesidiocoris tenuis TaxID=355587 RepID=A0A6H5GHD8_9HEMI|nr:unnamed protein product [Nesidiocoris tenuis]